MRHVMLFSAMGLLGLALISCATTPMSKSEKEQKQGDVRNMANKALADLYAKNPATKAAIAKSAGYAAFSDFGLKFIFMGGAGARAWR